MKKIVSLFIPVILLLSFCLVFVSCSDGKKEAEPETIKEYTVTFYYTSMGSVEVTRIAGTKKVKEGDVIGDVVWDDRSLGEGKAWYADRAATTPWNLYKDEVRCDMSLYLCKPNK